MINIDRGKCIECLKCVSVCPFKALGAVDGKPQEGEDKSCIRCLHCAAVCPQNAIRLDRLEGTLPVELPKLPDDYPELMEAVLMTRRSYRHFKPQPVPNEVIMHALRIAAWAPSAKNQHPAKWIVINKEKKIKLIMDLILEYVEETGTSREIAALYKRGQNVVMGNALTLILAYARTDAVNPPVDTALALYNAELILQSQGIGTCWAGYLTRMCNQVPLIRDILELPEGCQFYGALMAGYPDKEQYIHIPNRQKQPDIKWY